MISMLSSMTLQLMRNSVKDNSLQLRLKIIEIYNNRTTRV